MLAGMWRKGAQGRRIYHLTHERTCLVTGRGVVPMAVNVLSAAKIICDHSSWSITNLRLQKILYIAHMFYLGNHDGDALVHGNFEAWDLGPVHPTLYHKVKIYGAGPIGNIFRRVDDVEDESLRKVIASSVDDLSDFTDADLVGITHWDKGAWAKHYRPGVKGIEIPNSDILEEFELRVENHKQKQGDLA